MRIGKGGQQRQIHAFIDNAVKAELGMRQSGLVGGVGDAVRGGRKMRRVYAAWKTMNVRVAVLLGAR